MSYDTMDHVGWLERNIAAAKGGANKSDRRRAQDGKGWLAAPEKLNPFQQRVFTILGIVGGGIYNAPIEWDSVVWRHPRMVHLNWRSELATVDFSGLTTVVLLCHDARIRMSINANMRFLGLGFHERDPWTEEMHFSRGHMSIEQALARHRGRFPLGHHVHWCAPFAAEAAE